MSQISKQYNKKAGLPPGSIVYVGKEKTKHVSINEMNFSNDDIEESALKDISESKIFKKKPDVVSWLYADGVHDTEKIEAIGNFLNLDKLVQEDIVNTNTRPKFENLDDYMFLSMKMLRISADDDNLINDQLSLILGKGWVLSIDENEHDIFGQYRNRIRNRKGSTRQKKEDFVFYRLIDIVVDNYFELSEHISEQMDALEDKLIENRDESLAPEIYDLKKKIIQIKKSVVPLREAISAIIRSDSELILEDTQKYFRDVYEHIIQVIETVENQRETMNDFLNLYMSGLSNKMNEVMKFLTIFATIFIPLTFIAGIFGMNFDNMPELHWKYGYFISWGLMIAIAVVLLIYFRRKKWL